MQTGSNRIKRKVPRSAGLVRFVAVLALAAWALIALGGWVRALWAGVTGPGPATADEILLAGVSGLALVIGGWLWLGALLEGLSLLPGWTGRALRPIARVMVPHLARKGVALTLGVGLVSGVGGIAHAASPAPPASVSVSARSTVDDAPSPGWRPTAPTVRPQPSMDLRGPAARHTSSPTPGWSPSRDAGEREPGQVVVLRGDSLWSIAAAHLGPGATDADIAAEWPRWYAANVTIIGADPNVIRPGQVLTAPAGDPS